MSAAGDYQDVVVCQRGVRFGDGMSRLKMQFCADVVSSETAVTVDWNTDDPDLSVAVMDACVAWEKISRGPVKSRVSREGWRV